MGSYRRVKSETPQESWDRYFGGDDSAYNDLMIHYTPLVESTATAISYSLPSYVDVDDLISDGFFGLMDAIRRFDASMGYKFETYATFRIRGEIIDKLRGADWAPRSLRSKLREIDNASEQISNEKGREAKLSEIAELLGWDVADVSKALGESASANMTHLDESTNVEGSVFKLSDMIPDHSVDMSEIEMDDVKERLVEAIGELTDQQKAVLALYYCEGLPLKKIGNLLSVTESRACQIHTRTLDALRGLCIPG